jgi:hypothetical protein
MDTTKLQAFFNYCVGSWTTERTYHYLQQQQVERSRTEFVIDPLTTELKREVLQDNHYAEVEGLEQIPGYELSFHTVSETGEEVSQTVRFLFVPQRENPPYLEGAYLRDRAYEEGRPMVARFRYHTESRELLMTTYYAQVISVDSITLINPRLRIRRILNYLRPVEGEILDHVLLAGFGVEQKEDPNKT